MDEAVLVHPVARIGFDGLLESIRASWVKPGLEGDSHLRFPRCNEMGGTPMNESISRASDAAHGQEVTGDELATHSAPLVRSRPPQHRL